MITVEIPKWGVRDTFKRLEELRGIHVHLQQVLHNFPPYVDFSFEIDRLLRSGDYEEIENRFPRPNIKLHAHWPLDDQPEYLRRVSQVFDYKTARLVGMDYLLLNGVRADLISPYPDAEATIRNFENPEAALFFPQVDFEASFLPETMFRAALNTTRVEGNIYI